MRGWHVQYRKEVYGLVLVSFFAAAGGDALVGVGDALVGVGVATI